MVVATLHNVGRPFPLNIYVTVGLFRSSYAVKISLCGASGKSEMLPLPPLPFLPCPEFAEGDIAAAALCLPTRY